MPLAHILAPQIMKKAQQIEADLGRSPQGTGYLSQPRMQTVGYEKTPYDPQGLVNKPEATRFDPNDAMTGGGMQNAIGHFQRSGDPVQQAFARGFMLREGGLQAKSQILPNAPVPAPVEPAKPDKRGRLVMPAAKRGEPVAVDEMGRSIDARGKKLGYLNTPAAVTPYGDVPLRTQERRYGDVIMGQKPGSLEQTDPFSVTALQQRYGTHYRASDVDQFGVPNLKFPTGYFKGKSKAEIEDIKNGVKALAALQAGTRT